MMMNDDVVGMAQRFALVGQVSTRHIVDLKSLFYLNPGEKNHPSRDHD